MAKFAQAVRRERRLLEMSQETLAERAGLHRNFVGRFERGTTSISLDAAERLARALGFELKDML
ncbi:helix-turn-helix domain-containing protein [Chitinimonas koreensis]|uniref:helix-turn-helix domain-containing protein n=1 Tax=Chitinimonas koreensis TaxID=356302 RepID=UPI001FE0042E|nr:helix-turn-helix transcriptional regulator [Chitinimonas koreensis]